MKLGRLISDREKARRAYRAARLSMLEAAAKKIPGATVVDHPQRGPRIVRAGAPAQVHREIVCARCKRLAPHSGAGLCQRCYIKYVYTPRQRAAALAMPVVPYRYFGDHPYYANKARFEEYSRRLAKEHEAGERRPPGLRTILGKMHEEKCAMYKQYLADMEAGGCTIPDHPAYTCHGGGSEFRNVLRLVSAKCP